MIDVMINLQLQYNNCSMDWVSTLRGFPKIKDIYLIQTNS